MSKKKAHKEQEAPPVESDGFIPCTLKGLEEGQTPAKAEQRIIEAAVTAVDINPKNRPSSAAIRLLARMLRGLGGLPSGEDKEEAVLPYEEFDPEEIVPPSHIAMITTKYWGDKGVDLGVYFMDTQDSSLKNKILEFMNHWGKHGNIKFRESSANSAQVRIARKQGDGYWSYLGTDILQVGRSYPTMNLDSFSLTTPDSEYARVVEHETGHTLGFPHEHMRQEIVAKLDPQKTIEYFRRTQGWSAAEVQAQVLTPLDPKSIVAMAPDVTSIMCYQLPGSITKDSTPIPGGTQIDPEDGKFVAKVYPLADTGGGGGNGGGPKDTLLEVKKAGTYKLVT